MKNNPDWDNPMERITEHEGGEGEGGHDSDHDSDSDGPG